MQMLPLSRCSRSPQPDPSSSPSDAELAQICAEAKHFDPAVLLMRLLGRISPMSSPTGDGTPFVETILIAGLAEKLKCSKLAIEEAVANLRATLLKEGDGPTEQYYVHLLIVAYLQLVVQISHSATEGSDANKVGLERALERVRESRVLCHQVLRDCRALAAGKVASCNNLGASH
jgi:hypothetical protein